MEKTTYRDLAEHGLPFVTPDDPAFAALAGEIQNRPLPLEPVAGDLTRATVLLNKSGKAVVVLAHVWKYTDHRGRTWTARQTNLGSSMQLDVLAGQAQVTRDRFSFFLPGSKRLITENGMFGDNLDVLPPEPEPPGTGYVMGRGGTGRQGERDEAAAVELRLDLAIFEDGFCAGPDEEGLFDQLSEDLRRRREASAQIAEMLQAGATAGQAFDVLRPLANRRHAGRLLPMFANMAIHRLIQDDGKGLLEWFGKAAEPAALQLHR